MSWQPLPEWVRFPNRPDLGHHPDPERPTHTRCGMPLAGAEPVERPRYAHTACFPSLGRFVDGLWSDDDAAAPAPRRA